SSLLSSTTTLIGTPFTDPPKSSTAIFTPSTDPWPEVSENTVDRSVITRMVNFLPVMAAWAGWLNIDRPAMTNAASAPRSDFRIVPPTLFRGFVGGKLCLGGLACQGVYKKHFAFFSAYGSLTMHQTRAATAAGERNRMEEMTSTAPTGRAASDGGVSDGLSLEGVTKSFGGFIAVNDVTLNFPAGAIYGIIGPNGAGKTTLFNLLSGFLKPTRGRLRHRGQDVTRLSPEAIAR